MNYQYLVRFGRSDDSVIKTVFMPTRKTALHLANALSYLFWYRHVFKSAECQCECTRKEHDGFWVEFRRQDKPALLPEQEQPEYLFQGD